MSEFIGIDLGTTNSVIAYIDESGDPKIQVNAAGENITQSAVYIDDQNVAIIGTEAIKQSEFGFKIWKEFKRDIGVNITYDSINNISITPEYLSSLVLKKLKQDYISVRSKDITSAVITYPANFTNEKREATILAGKLSDLPLGPAINEPTAAALYFATQENLPPGKYAIYDFGGGTWDISVAEVHGKEINVITTNGLVECGGKDFDKQLEILINEKFKSQAGMDIDLSIQSQSIFESTKKSLTIRENTNVAIRQNNAPPVTLNISRDEFEKSISTILAQTEIICKSLFNKHDDISDVLLVGGSTRVPAVVNSITKTFGKPPLIVGNPDEVVALGAALYSAIRSDSSKLNSAQSNHLSKVSFQEISNHYLGIASLQINESSGSWENKPSYIIEKGTKIPCSVKETYFTTHENQDGVDIEVIQSQIPETDMRFVNIQWKGTLNLPPNLPASEEINVNFEITEDGILHCSFSHSDSGNIEKITLAIDYEITDDKKTDIEAFFVE